MAWVTSSADKRVKKGHWLYDATSGEKAMQFQIHSYIHHAKKRCQEPPQFHFKELQSKNPWPTLLGNDFACFLQENKSDRGTKKYLANIRVPIRVTCNLLFSFKENAMQLLLEKFGEILVIRKRLMRKGRKRLKT